MILPRITLSLALGLLIASSSFAAGAGTDAEWLVQVGSTYKDEATGKLQTFHGTGTIVKIGDSLFVVTASHVSQGTNLTLKTADRTLHAIPNERLSDNLADIELIRVTDKDLVPFGVLADNRFGETKSMIVGPVLGSGANVEGLSITPSGDDRIPQASWTSAKADEWRGKSVPAKQGLGITDISGDRYLRYNLARNEYVADVQIRPGMSGAPLIGREYLNGYAESKSDNSLPGAEHYVLRGITKSYSRAFEQSQFATSDQILALVEHFTSGKRGFADQTRWHLRNGLTYRDLGNGTIEVNPTVLPAGGGGSADGGGGGSADGGGGGSADGGDSIAPVGDVYSQFGIAPGVMWHGAPAIAFKAQHKSGKIFVLNGDLTSIRLLSESREFSQVEPIGNPVEIGNLIFSKASQMNDKSSMVSGLDLVYSCFIDVGATAKDGVRISIGLPNEDSLNFALDQKGELTEPISYPFRPVQNVLSKRNRKAYRVDITGLFSVGLGALRGDAVTMNSNSEPDLGKILDYSKKPYLLIKADKSSRDRPIFCAPRKATPKPDSQLAGTCALQHSAERPEQLASSVQAVLGQFLK